MRLYEDGCVCVVAVVLVLVQGLAYQMYVGSSDCEMMVMMMVVFSPGLTGRVCRLDETRMEYWLPVSLTMRECFEGQRRDDVLLSTSYK